MAEREIWLKSDFTSNVDEQIAIDQRKIMTIQNLCHMFAERANIVHICVDQSCEPKTFMSKVKRNMLPICVDTMSTFPTLTLYAYCIFH